MDIQATFIQIGNSIGVGIPRGLREKYGFKKGEKVKFEEREEGLMLKGSKYKNNAAGFKKWWDEFIKENGEILDELAVR